MVMIQYYKRFWEVYSEGAARWVPTERNEVRAEKTELLNTFIGNVNRKGIQRCIMKDVLEMQKPDDIQMVQEGQKLYLLHQDERGGNKRCTKELLHRDEEQGTRELQKKYY